jgi:hypothetical protein
MTISFPEMKTGPRLGLAAAVTGCLAVVLLVGLPLRAQDANPVLAKVNGSEIRQSDVALAEEELGPSLAQMDPAAKKENVLAFLIDMKIVAKAAEDKKIENSEEFKKRLAFTRNRLLMDSLLASEGKAATTDDAMRTPPSRSPANRKFMRGTSWSKPRTKRRRSRKNSRRARILPSSRRRNRRIRARPMAAISASSPRTRWCRNSPTSPSRSSPARSPIR